MASLESFWYRARKRVAQRLTTRSHEQFKDLENCDWDVAIVLDACRHDVLESVANWPIGSTRSPASCTPEWLGQVADRGAFRDFHVVSGSPQYDAVNLGAANTEAYYETHWDADLQTTPPEPILDRVSELLDSQERRVVAHLMQPHWPYIAKINESWRVPYADTGPWQTTDGEEFESMQVAMERGKIDVLRARRAYRASVASIWQTLIPYLEEWSEDATVVLTSDHGESFGRLRGELGFYEHPCNCHIKPLTTVPWATFSPLQHSETATESVEEQLKALGYQ